jgi:hypothetical protein
MKIARTLVLLCAFFATGASQVHTFNMTGTWEGRWDCRVLENGIFTTLSNPFSIMKITHVGSIVYVDLDNGSYRYRGWAGAEKKKPNRGATTVVDCQTSPESRLSNEVISANVTTAPSETPSGQFYGISAYNSTDSTRH